MRIAVLSDAPAETRVAATPETVKKAFEILNADPKVKSIFINIFGGIMRCDYIAEGVIKAAQELNMKIPLIVRLKGTKEAEAKQYVLTLKQVVYGSQLVSQDDPRVRLEDHALRRAR